MSEWEDMSDEICYQVGENYDKEAEEQTSITQLEKDIEKLQQRAEVVENFLYAEDRIQCESCRLSWEVDVETYIGNIENGMDSVLPSIVNYAHCQHCSSGEITSAQPCKRRKIVISSSSESEASQEENSQRKRKLERLKRIRDLDFETTSESSSSQESTDLWTCYGKGKNKKVFGPKTFDESNKELFRYSKSKGFLPDPENWVVSGCSDVTSGQP